MGLLGACNTIQGAPGACANKRPADTGLLGYVFNSCRPAFKLDKLSIDTDIPVFPHWEWHCGPPFLGFTTLEPCARYSRRAMRWPLWGGAVFLCCGLIIARVHSNFLVVLCTNRHGYTCNYMCIMHRKV